MKTILYQPLFINPQAYFVFPQLYHIEKGDSYIEPANITGQLIINDLTKSLTLTPILNVVQDTNQVDFGLFKGKHIRISQYTNIGAVVLGEMKNSIKNNIFGAVVYFTTALLLNSSTSLLMLFVKENSDRCHYYNGKWNKKDLAIGISSIVLGSIAKYFITLI